MRLSDGSLEHDEGADQPDLGGGESAPSLTGQESSLVTLDISSEAAPPDDVQGGSWHYLSDEHEQHGPMTWADLQSMYRERVIGPDTFIFCEGKMDDWATASLFDLDGLEPE